MSGRELPSAEAQGPIAAGADSNSVAKRRQAILWTIITLIMGLGGSLVVFQIMKPAQNRDGPEAARRIMATADLARGKSQSGETEASELSVRVAEMDRQLADINGKNQQLSAETEALRMQLVEERKDALRTIDALNGQVQSKPPSPASAPTYAPSSGPASGMAQVSTPSVQLTAQIGGPNSPTGANPFQPMGASAAVPTSQMAPPRRSLATLRSTSSVNTGPGPSVSTGSATAQGGAARPEGGAGSFMTPRGQTFDTSRFVPPNAYTKAKVLVGVDAATGVTNNADPKPVLFRITGPAVHVGQAGRFQTTDLSGCLVNGAAYGELSSEKIYVRLQRISCPAGPRQVSVATVEGYASHMGKAGVRGRVISREGGLTGRAMLAGTLQGLGNSLTKYTDAKTSAFGLGTGAAVTAQASLDARDVASGSVGGGVANAAEMLADYYVKRAEQYQPVVEMPTGIEVELVFLSGFEIASTPSR